MRGCFRRRWSEGLQASVDFVDWVDVVDLVDVHHVHGVH